MDDEDDDGIMHALPVGDAALANEFARVAASGERISCDDIVDWVCRLLIRSMSPVLPATSSVPPFCNDGGVDVDGPSLPP